MVDDMSWHPELFRADDVFGMSVEQVMAFVILRGWRPEMRYEASYSFEGLSSIDPLVYLRSNVSEVHIMFANGRAKTMLVYHSRGKVTIHG